MISKEMLTISNLNKIFRVDGKEVPVLQDINLSVKHGELVCILGTSGCGKSTLLRTISGLDQDYDGEISVNNQKVSGPGLDRGMVFQDARLYPWLTVEKNVNFGLREDIPKNERMNIVHDHLKLVGLSDFANAYPHQLSGGMQQRANIARALVNNPEMLLLDEPFGAIDALTRIQMQQEILKIWEQEQVTMLLITHDINEAIFLADRIIILSKRPGKIVEDINIPVPRPRHRNNSTLKEIQTHIHDLFFYNDSPSNKNTYYEVVK